MSILKTTLLSQMLVTNQILAADEIGDVEGGDKLIQKYRKLLKTGKSSKSQKLARSGKILSKSGNLPNFDA